VTSVPRHRRKRKIRRTGQHTTPSQVEKVAQTAGKAAPAVVVVGTLATTAPHIGGAVTASPAATAPHVVRAHLDAAALPAGQTHAAATQAASTQAASTQAAATGSASDQAAATEAASAHAARTQAAVGGKYTVQSGNTLSGITQRFYGKDANWRSLYAANEAAISNPNMIYVGEELRLPRHLPAPAGRACRGVGLRGQHAPGGVQPPARRVLQRSLRDQQRGLHDDHHEPVRHTELQQPGSSVGLGGRVRRGRGHRRVHRDGRVRR